MQPIDFYNNQIFTSSATLKKLRKQRNAITITKIALFIFIIFSIIYFSMSVNYVWLGLFVASIVAFIILNIYESKLLNHIEYNVSLKKIADIEIEYLKGNLENLDNGAEFKNPNHPYTHDLDIFGDSSIFQTINRSFSPYGKQQLSCWLQTPLKNKEDIIKRQEALRELSKIPEFTNEIRAVVYNENFSSNIEEEIIDWKQTDYNHPNCNFIFLYIYPAICLTLWILSILNVIIYAIPITFSVIQLLIVLLTTKKINEGYESINSFIKSFSSLYELIKSIHGREFQSNKLKNISESLFNSETSAYNAIKKLSNIQDKFDQRSNLLATIFMNGLYARDLHLYKELKKWKEKYIDLTPGWLESIRELDALNSLAIYCFNHPEYIFPSVNENIIIKSKGLGHPLIDSKDCITNDFQIKQLHEFYIVTGANMAGKSTFLRAVGVNFVLACCGSVVYAESLEFHPMFIFTSMRTVDNLASGTSYFHAELLRLKDLVETAEKQEKVFIILDEILKGTNSVDKLNGSRKFLQKLLTLPISGLVATHDLELGKLAQTYPNNYYNFCFEITHTTNDILYDYKLKEGISKNMNASILLEKMDLV